MYPFLDLNALNERDENKIMDAVRRVLRSGTYILGPEVERFESEFAHFCGSKYAIGVGNGLSALTLILRAYKALGALNENSEVIVPNNSFIATALAVDEANLTLRLIDPDNNTMLLSPETVEAAITPRTGAIIAVHLYGRLIDMTPLKKFAKKHKLILIED